MKVVIARGDGNSQDCLRYDIIRILYKIKKRVSLELYHEYRSQAWKVKGRLSLLR